jgi:broad specificity phosphatase PhoE
LGKFLANKGLNLTYIFSSDLQRAFKTADALRSWHDAAQPGQRLEVTALDVLREQDFGFFEGKPFHARPKASNKSGKDAHRAQHLDDPDFKDVESKESMAVRMNAFLQDHLIPLIRGSPKCKGDAIAIVSHGIILSHLWRCFLKLLPTSSVTLAPGLSVGTGSVTPLEYLGGWSNTGYLELDIQKQDPAQGSMVRSLKGASPTPSHPSEARSIDFPPPLDGYNVCIKTVNGKEHLQGLKRTKGVGSSKFDEGQKSIDSFFKKRKVTSGQD